ncbi:hypothetical protein Calkr_0302 [Caldicellulosiruptor acetigenus I77R1B]|uniref:Uncharacterized protein n=3 Tax=Caldicellulosiruptor TaxID=44000 RepID=G2PVM1_9FIRM|nr:MULTISPECIES: bacteriocin [Caldicellulosiruptor]ADQ39865.1 hypothetical protein Calkr_0302 [Caldicellulosiruptor acetigenus I77R1B]AEM74621.1 hypothetical protein Calla_2057 [Caldicellulosiruptor acetigenus 6A]WAM34919.1 bacteriocin [Caldicellulosiruptor morganii]
MPEYNKKDGVGKSFEELDEEEMKEIIGSEEKNKKSILVCMLISGGVSAVVSLITFEVTKKLI